MKVSPHPTTLPLGSISRSDKPASTSAICPAVIWSTVASCSRVTGCPQARSRTNSRQKASWSPRNPSASCLASSSSEVECIYLLLGSRVPGWLLIQRAKPSFIAEAAERRLEHGAHIRRARGGGVNHVLEIACPQARAYGKGEQVDDLLGMHAHQMRPQDTLGSLLDEHLVAGMRQRHPPRRIPTRRVLVLRRKAPALRAIRLLKQAHACQGRGSENHAANPGRVPGEPVPPPRVVVPLPSPP